MTKTLELLAPSAMTALGARSLLCLNARIGGKNAEFIDLKHEVIHSPEGYVALWIRGLLESLEQRRPLVRGDSYYELFLAIRNKEVVREYVTMFLKRTYLRNCNALSRVRPHVNDSELWIGQERASYGILITPRFVNGRWENDKSEIRHFPHQYWTIGHVIHTGFVVPNDPDKIMFRDVESYLAFFKNTLVRASGSMHERRVAERYVTYVRDQAEPRKVPLLIPEFRYHGLAPQHKYRLDFTVVDQSSMQKVGFELSPWSTHGKLSGRDKTLTQLNAEARENFEKEMRKQKDYLRKHDVYALVYTDSDLADPDRLFEDVKRYLVPKQIAPQLELHAFDELFRFRT